MYPNPISTQRLLISARSWTIPYSSTFPENGLDFSTSSDLSNLSMWSACLATFCCCMYSHDAGMYVFFVPGSLIHYLVVLSSPIFCFVVLPFILLAMNSFGLKTGRKRLLVVDKELQVQSSCCSQGYVWSSRKIEGKCKEKKIKRKIKKKEKNKGKKKIELKLINYF